MHSTLTYTHKRSGVLLCFLLEMKSDMISILSFHHEERRKFEIIFQYHRVDIFINVAAPKRSGRGGGGWELWKIHEETIRYFNWLDSFPEHTAVMKLHSHEFLSTNPVPPIISESNQISCNLYVCCVHRTACSVREQHPEHVWSHVFIVIVFCIFLKLLSALLYYFTISSPMPCDLYHHHQHLPPMMVYMLTCNRKLCDPITSKNQNVFRYIGHTFQCKSFPVISDFVLLFIFDSFHFLFVLNQPDGYIYDVSREKRENKKIREEWKGNKENYIQWKDRPWSVRLSVCAHHQKFLESRCSRSSSSSISSSSSCYYYCLSLGYKYILLWVIFRSFDHILFSSSHLFV